MTDRKPSGVWPPTYTKRYLALKQLHQSKKSKLKIEQLFHRHQSANSNLHAVSKAYSALLPSILEFALSLEGYFNTNELPLLPAGEAAYVELSSDEVRSLLANAFLCTFDFTQCNCDGITATCESCLNNNRYEKNYQCFSFRVMFAEPFEEYKQSMIECLLRYFQTPADKTKIVYERRVLNQHVDWFNSDKLIADACLIIDDKHKIEELPNVWHADFANRFIGGGALTGGNVQEEIRFNVSPELLVSMLLCEAMQDNEAIVVYGSRQFSDYTGYGSAFRGKDWSPSRKQQLQASTVFAIDALDLRGSRDPLRKQYRSENLVRELNKFYCAVKPHDAQVTTKRKRPIAGGYSECEGWQAAVNNSQLPPVATGNWGCGAFLGDRELKALLQIMAAAQAGRSLIYCTFDDAKFSNELEEVYGLLANVSIGNCLRLVRIYIESNIFTYKKLFVYVWECFESEPSTLSPAHKIAAGNVPVDGNAVVRTEEIVTRQVNKNSKKNNSCSPNDAQAREVTATANKVKSETRLKQSV